jgi:ring-1,2-phenylacetyl-CoA epoxidase subunit PaaD
MGEGEERGRGEAVPCPFCGSRETTLLALFGQFLLTSQYYCEGCRSVFEAVKREEKSEE